MLNLAIILLLGVIAANQVRAQGCILNVSSTLFLVVYQDLKMPDNSEIKVFDSNEEFYIGCPQGTVSALLSDDGEKVTCIDGTFVMTRTKASIDLTDIKCEEKLPSNVRKVGSVCEEKGILVEVGFNFQQNFIPAYSICFDEKNLAPLSGFYNETILSLVGTEVGTNTENRFVDSGRLYGDIVMDDLYLNQKSTFEQMGLSQYINDTTYLIPGQLLPSFIFTYPLKVNASFDYANVIPTWNTLENYFEYFYVYFGGDALPYHYVGTSGVATLRNDVGVEVELYLYDGKIPVPRWFWATFEGGKEYTFTVWGYNNPYFDMIEVTDEFLEIIDSLGHEANMYGLYENSMFVGVSSPNKPI